MNRFWFLTIISTNPPYNPISGLFQGELMDAAIKLSIKQKSVIINSVELSYKDFLKAREQFILWTL